jgi:hypothetical protein
MVSIYFTSISPLFHQSLSHPPAQVFKDSGTVTIPLSILAPFITFSTDLLAEFHFDEFLEYPFNDITEQILSFICFQ